MITVLHNPFYLDAFYGEKHIIQKHECIPVAEVATNNLEIAFTYTNNIDSSWVKNDDVIVLPGAYLDTKRGCRSTSGGDVMIKDGQYYVILAFGYCTYEEYLKNYIQ